MSAPVVVQSQYTDLRTTPAIVTLNAAPAPGNLLICCLLTSNANDFGASSGWTGIAYGNYGSGNDAINLFYRYVKEGDTATLPQIQTSEDEGYNAAIVWEISGVLATWADVLDQQVIVFNAHEATEVTATYTTQYADELALISYGTEWVFGLAPTLSPPWTQDQSGAGFAKNAGAGHNTYSAIGSAVQATINWGVAAAQAPPYGASSANYALILLRPAGSAPAPPATKSGQTVVFIIES